LNTRYDGIVENKVLISYSLELINGENFIEEKKHLREILSDDSKRFIYDTLEEHNYELINRLVKQTKAILKKIYLQI
jgi:hypothetical protein